MISIATYLVNLRTNLSIFLDGKVQHVPALFELRWSVLRQDVNTQLQKNKASQRHGFLLALADGPEASRKTVVPYLKEKCS